MTLFLWECDGIFLLALLSTQLRKWSVAKQQKQTFEDASLFWFIYSFKYF
jgi:hypothetical protein